MSEKTRNPHQPVSGNARDGLRSLQARLNDLLEEFWRKIGAEHHSVSGRAASGVTAETDLSRVENNLHLAIELPGMDIDDIEILARGSDLIVRGEKRLEREVEGQTYYLRERAFGEFSRSFHLPEGARPDDATARYRNGVLEIDVPCEPTSASKIRKIRIQST